MEKLAQEAFSLRVTSKLRLALITYHYFLNAYRYSPALYAAKTLLLLGKVQNHKQWQKHLPYTSLGHKQCHRYKTVHLKA